MPKFSKISRERLSGCHNDLQVLFNEVIENFDCTVLCGQRGEDEQNEAFEKGFSKLKFPQSKHNKVPSLAVDVVPYPVNWKNTNRMRFFAGYVLGIAEMMYNMGWLENRIRWGGDWDMDTETNDQRFDDLPHFEIVLKHDEKTI